MEIRRKGNEISEVKRMERAGGKWRRRKRGRLNTYYTYSFDTEVYHYKV